STEELHACSVRTCCTDCEPSPVSKFRTIASSACAWFPTPHPNSTRPHSKLTTFFISAPLQLIAFPPPAGAFLRREAAETFRIGGKAAFRHFPQLVLLNLAAGGLGESLHHGEMAR